MSFNAFLTEEGPFYGVFSAFAAVGVFVGVMAFAQPKPNLSLPAHIPDRIVPFLRQFSEKAAQEAPYHCPFDLYDEPPQVRSSQGPQEMQAKRNIIPHPPVRVKPRSSTGRKGGVFLRTGLPLETPDDPVRDFAWTRSQRLNACYQNLLRKLPSLAGQVVVHLSIRSGRIRKSTVQHNGTGNGSLERCILTEIRSWRLDREVEREETLTITFASST
jgi:hypothetical protein